MATPAPNFYDENTGQAVYIQTTVDRSLRAVLEHRGIAEARIAALLVDLDGPCSLACVELDTLLPCGTPSTMRGERHIFQVRLSRDAEWDGERLKVTQRMPATLLAALPGRSLREVVDHPALPDRTILSVEESSTWVEIRVAPDQVPVLELAQAPRMLANASPKRSRNRRKWIDQSANTNYEADWIDWINSNRQNAVSAFLAGDPPDKNTHCWGSAPLSPMPAVRALWQWIRDSLAGNRKGEIARAIA